MDENKILTKYNHLCNNHNINDYINNKGNRRMYYLLPRWITNLDDEWISRIRFNKELSKYDLNPQLYYDIISLNIKNISDRPRCPVCGNYLKFISICNGYYITCSRKCGTINSMTEDRRLSVSNQFKGLKRSQESRRKQSESLKGKVVISDDNKRKLSELMRNRIVSDSTRKRMSESFRNKWSDPEYRIRMKQIRSNYYKDNPDKLDKFIKCYKKNTKRGYYNSKKYSDGNSIFYMSSYELKFLELCDKSDNVIKISKPPRFYYNYNGINRVYIPDFKVELSSGKVLIIEIKPAKFLDNDQVVSKKNSALIECKKLDYEYRIVTELDLKIGLEFINSL